MEIVEVFIQTLLAFFALFFYSRLLGKQQLSQLTFFEYATGITFGSIAGTLATDIGPQRTLMHFLALTLFTLLTYTMQFIVLKNRPARKVIEGEPTVIIQNGKILEDKLAGLKYNMDELRMLLREKGFFKVADIEYAIAEPNGEISVLSKSQKRPVTPEDLQIPTDYEGVEVELIQDGEIIFQNLTQNNLDLDWLKNQLQQRGITDLNQVVFAGLDTQGNFYLDTRQDAGSQPVDATDKPPD